MLRLILTLPLLLVLAACNREQPPGIPELPAASKPAPTTPPPAAPAPAPKPFIAPSSSLGPAPPPMPGDIEPFPQTGFPACDDYLEAYRRCINRNLSPGARGELEKHLKASMLAIHGSVSRGVDALRIAKQCERARARAIPKVQSLGCAL